MVVGSILGWIVAGLIVGALARALMPGRQHMGIVMTIVLGIVGAMVGGFISTMLFGPRFALDPSGNYMVETAWPGWIMAVIGGLLVLWAAIAASGGMRSNRMP